jgi:uncharacterized DUF497 family protein
MEFQWDPKKAKLDIEKHGVGFAEAEEAFRTSSQLTNSMTLIHSMKSTDLR